MRQKLPRTHPKGRIAEGSILVVERYPSMEGLLAMWNSPGFQAAKKLTAGLVDVNFTVAIEDR